jgi:hypothetical protein
MMSSAAVLVKTFRATRKPFRAPAKTVRLPAGIAVRLQPGILFVFTPESFSRSPRSPFRLDPESADFGREGAATTVMADRFQRSCVTRGIQAEWDSRAVVRFYNKWGTA